MTVNLLVSFGSPGFETEFGLGLVDAATGSLSAVGLGAIRAQFPFAGLAGLCRAGDRIVAGLRVMPELRGGLAFLDRDLRPVDIRLLERVRDVHSIVAISETLLLIVSSGTDEIIEYDCATGVERVAYAASAGGTDTMHLNGLCLHRGRPVVSMFGPQRKRALRLGRVVDIGSGDILLDGLRQPHSVCSAGDFLLVFESETGHLIKFDGERTIDPWISCMGYMRGLCLHEDELVMGRSRRRRPWRGVSAWSKERLVSLAGPEGLEHEQAALLIRGSNGATRAIRLEIGVNEIYDILPLPAGWGESAALLPPAWLAAYAAFGRGDHATVERLLADAGGDEALPLQLLMQARLAAGDYTGATACFRRLGARVERDPALLRLASAGLGALGQADAALEAARRAHALEPHNADTILVLAQRLKAAKRPEEELALLEAATRDDSGEGRLWYAFGNALRGAGTTGRAMRAAREAVRHLPNDAAAHTLLARTLRELSRAEEAKAPALFAAELDPSSAPVFAELAEVMLVTGDLAGAIAALRQAVALEPERAQRAARLQRLEARAARGNGQAAAGR